MTVKDFIDLWERLTGKGVLCNYIGEDIILRSLTVIRQLGEDTDTFCTTNAYGVVCVHLGHEDITELQQFPNALEELFRICEVHEMNGVADFADGASMNKEEDRAELVQKYGDDPFKFVELKLLDD